MKKLRTVVIMETSREKALSRSSRTSSSTHSTILKRKAQLEANKTKTKYAEQQADILRRKLELDAELSLIQIKQEAEALETEIRVMESESVIAEDIDSVSDVREERTRKYIEEHFVNIDDLAISKDSLCHVTTTTPVVTSSDQVSTCAAPGWSPITSHSQTLLSNVTQYESTYAFTSCNHISSYSDRILYSTCYSDNTSFCKSA